MLRFFRQLLDPSEMPAGELDLRQIHLAAAILLFEVAKSDQSLEAAELRQLEGVLRAQWALDEQALAELTAVARREAELSASLYQQVELLNQQCSPGQKYALLRGLWQVAYADGELHHYEEHLIRRIADLLYISHTDFMRAKHEVMGA